MGSRSLAVSLAAVVAALLAAAPAARAGNNGQQVALSYFSSGNCAAVGPPTNVTITGHNQNNQLVTWHQNSTAVMADNHYANGWWWRGGVTVSWTKRGTAQRYSTNAWIPSYDEPANTIGSFEMWKDIVAVDCRGSLRKASSQFVVHGDGGHAI